jgi:hypothetical protein
MELSTALHLNYLSSCLNFKKHFLTMVRVLKRLALGFLMIFFLGIKSLTAQKPTLKIVLDTTAYQQGDTIHFSAMVPEWANTTMVGTLNVWIEEVNHRNMWKLRYPVLSGVCDVEIVIPKNLPADYYAFYFQLQNDFFGLTGKTENKLRNDSLNYSMLVQSKDWLAGRVALREDGSFELPPYIFPESATIFFSESRKRKNNSDFNVNIENTLDSAFTPIADTLVMVKAGNIDSRSVKENYTFQKEVFLGGKRGTLDEVVVVAERKKPIEIFDAQVSSGPFTDVFNTRIFDGLEGQFLGFFNILSYLQGRVAGLQIQQFGTDYYLQWRGQTTAIYLDQIAVDAKTISTIPLVDIAMIKVFSPPFFGAPTGGGGGAVAIYTKRGGGLEVSRFRSRFVLNGYTPLEYELTVGWEENL